MVHKSKTVALRKFTEKLEEQLLKLPVEMRDKERASELQKFEDNWEDNKKFNKRIKSVVEEVEKLFPKNDEGYKRIRDIIVPRLCSEKRKFLFGHDEETQVNDPNVRTYAPGKEPTVRQILPDNVSPEELVPLETETPEVLMKKFEDEITEKYSNIDELTLVRPMILQEEVKKRAEPIMLRVQMERKIRQKRENLTALWSKRYNPIKLKLEVDAYIKEYEAELETHWMSQKIDPYEYDEKSIKLAETIWADVKDKRPKMAQDGAEGMFEYFSKKYKEFHNSFPVVVKYMVYQDLYDKEAFYRFLRQNRKNVAMKTLAPQNPMNNPQNMVQRTKLNDSERVWLQNQASYVQFLYEEKAKSRGAHLDHTHAIRVRDDAYKMLKKEMLDFRTEFQKTADRVKKETQDNDVDILSETIKDFNPDNMTEAEYTLFNDLYNKLNSGIPVDTDAVEMKS